MTASHCASATTLDFVLRAQTALAASSAADVGDGVQRISTTVLGINVDQYSWTDSQGLTRTVSLKQEGNGNTGHGGYAVQMTYQVPNGGTPRTVTANMASGGDGGFGYFVAHELYRSFSDGSSGTIAALHGQDDSPLGLDFPVTTSQSTIAASSTVATETFRLTYPKWGTIAPIADPTADKSTPVATSAHQLFNVPVKIVWTFQKNTDYPRIDVSVDISASSAGQLAFDMRGPYGVLEYADSDTNATINNVQWADSAYLFTSNVAVTDFLQQGSSWNWSATVGSVRPFQGMIAKHSNGTLYEIGLFEMKLGSDEGLTYSGYASHRGSNGTGFYTAANGIEQYEWPFQSAQYSGSAGDGGWLANTKIYGKKFAWGTAPFYGSELSTVYLNDTTPAAIDAYPAGGVITYRTCWVMGLSTYTAVGTQGLTRTAAASASPSCATGTPTAQPTFQSLSPARLLDTRAGRSTVDMMFAGHGALGAQTELDLSVAGRGGIPVGAAAIVLNVTATDTTQSGFLTIWPAGAARPTASNINFDASATIPNLVIAKLSADGDVALFNSRGNTDVIADALGWFPSTSGLTALSPARLLETRSGRSTVDNQYNGIGTLAAKTELDLPVLNRGGVGSNAGAVVLNITATNSAGPGFVTAWPGGTARPLTSNLNINSNLTIANLAIVKVGGDGNVALQSSVGTDLIADVAGWFATPSELTALTPARIFDTRTSGGGSLASHAEIDVPVLGVGGVPAGGVDSVVVNVTVTNPTAAVFLTVWPSGETRPVSSNLNFTSGQTIANLVIAKVGGDGKIAIFNSAGSSDVVVDIYGWFAPSP